MSCKRREAIVFAQQVGNSDQHNSATPNLVYGHKRFARRGGNQNLRALGYHAIVAKDLSAQILCGFVWRQAFRVMRFGGRAGQSNTNEIGGQTSELS